MHHLLLALGALVPMGSVALIFVYAMRAVLRADRAEREALAAYDAQAVIDDVERGSSPGAGRSGGPSAAAEGALAGEVVASVDAPAAPRLPGR